MIKYNPISLPEPALTVAGQYTFFGIYSEFKTECETMYRKNGWALSTREQYDSIIRNTVYPHLRNHNFKSIAEYTKQDFDEAIRDIIAEGKKKGSSDNKEYDESTIQTFRRLIRTIVTVAFQNKKTLFNIYAEDFTDAKKKQLLEYYRRYNILPKSFSAEQEYKIAKYLSTTCLDRGESVGLLLLFCLGVRCSEAAGASFEDLYEIEEYPDFYFLAVLHTTGTNSNIIHVGGKTINANRIIPISKSVYIMLKQIEGIRREALQQAGIDLSGISKLPIACKGKDYLNRCDTPAISRAGRDMFIQIGMRKEYLIAISMTLDQERFAAIELSAEEEFALIEREPTSYALRRNAATHWHTLLGNDNAIAYLMGHKIHDPQIQQKEYSSYDLLYQIYQKLNLRPILNPIHPNDANYLPTFRVGSASVTGLKDVYDLVVTIPPHTRANIVVTPHIPGDDVRLDTLSDETEGSVHVQKCDYSQNTPRSARSANLIRMYHQMYYNVIQDYVISLPKSPK